MNKYKYHRLEIEKTQIEVAQIVGCTNQTISEIERGNTKPGITLAIKLA
jgi:DNA-binding XRE family transcriptional regulator